MITYLFPKMIPEGYTGVGYYIDSLLKQCFATSYEYTGYPHVGRNPKREIEMLPGDPLYLITGPSGGGKNTLLNALVDQGLALQCPTATTRGRRDNEAEDAYTWMGPVMPLESATKAQLEVIKSELMRTHNLLEINQYGQNLYGLPIPNLEKAILKSPVAIVCENNGAEKIEEHLKGRRTVIRIFITPPSFREIFERMGDTRVGMDERINVMPNEIQAASRDAHFIVINRSIARNNGHQMTIPAIEEICDVVEIKNSECKGRPIHPGNPMMYNLEDQALSVSERIQLFDKAEEIS